MKVQNVSAEVARSLLAESSDTLGLSHAADAITLVLAGEGGSSGALQLEILGFDSELFGVPVARMNVLTAQSQAGYAALLAACRNECRARGVRHVVRRMPVGQFTETWGLGGAGYRLVDVSVLFERRADVPAVNDAAIRLVQAGEAERLATRYAEAFTLTRFAVDPFITSAAASELHRRWIQNSCNGRADAVLVADIAGELGGFVTCRVDKASGTGGIELIAVDRAQRGAGTGRRLVAAALGWFSGRVERVQVRTQLNNLVATGLYQSSGFSLKFGELTYAWMDAAEDLR